MKRFPLILSFALLTLVASVVTPVPSSATTITIDTFHPGVAIPREMYGHNVTWYTMEKQYQGDLAMSRSLLIDYRNMGVGSLRYPGGCMADSFAWETSIGPYNMRGIQRLNGKPATDKFPASFGVDEYLRLCEQLGAEPQISLEFRAPDINVKNQAESVYSVATNVSGQIGVGDLGLDEGTSVSLPASGDAAKLSFSVSRDGYYRLVLKNRAGKPGDSTFFWRTNSYSYLLDGEEAVFTNDNSTVSSVDPIDAQTTWGTTRSDVVYLRYGSHDLRVTAGSGSLKLDYLEVQELNHTNSVCRAAAWIAYCNGDPSDTRSLGVDGAGIDWKTVGYWAEKRVQNGHPEPYAVKYWEVGNEAWGPDPYGSPPGRDPIPYNNGWIDYYDAAKTVDPNLRLSLCGYSPSTWTDSLIQTHGGKASYVHFHPYHPNDKTVKDGYQLYLEGVTSAVGVQTYIDQYKASINTYQPGRLGRLKGSASEWSAAYGWSGANDSWSARMSAVLTVADQLGTMIKNCDLMESTQFWSSYATNIYTIFTEYNTTDYYKQGIYEAFSLFGNRFGDRVVPATVSSDCPTYSFGGFGSRMPAGNYPMLSAYASQDSSNYYLVVINKDTVNAQSATMLWLGLATCTNRIKVYTISSSDALPNYTSINSIGVTPIRTTVTSLKPYKPSISYSFPACSVTGFVVERAKPANPIWHREAEDIFTVNTDSAPFGNIVSEGPWALDSGGHVRLGDAGDSVVIPFNIRRNGVYTIRLRNRCGQAGGASFFWDSNAYSYYLDGKPVTLSGVAGSISAIDGLAYWGTAQLTDRLLSFGRHYLKIKAEKPDLMLDWVELEEERYQNWEAEDCYSVVKNQSGQIAKYNLSLDSNSHLRIGSGDVVDINLDVQRTGFYETWVRVRSGDNSTNSANLLPSYTWSIDGSPVTYTQDTDTLSISDGSTYWMTVKLPKKLLSARRHTLRVSYGSSTSGRIDYATITPAVLSAAIQEPTTDASYITAKPAITLSAYASDDASQMGWRNTTGDLQLYPEVNSISVSVPLAMGTNNIVAWANDLNGASAVDSLTVTRIAGDKTIPDAKKLKDGSHVELASVAVTGIYDGFFYVEEPGRSHGIKVKPSAMPQGLAIGSIVCVYGSIATDPTGERYISGTASVQ